MLEVEDSLLNSKEVAEILDCSPDAVNELARKNVLPAFYPRIARVIRSLAVEPGARVLELGVGTGLSLDAYPSHCQVTGIDLAPDMLERAQDKVNRNAWRHIMLEQGDALNLKFPDDSFDYVMAFLVVSVVPDPDRMMTEARRVCRPGGTIAIIN